MENTLSFFLRIFNQFNSYTVHFKTYTMFYLSVFFLLLLLRLGFIFPFIWLFQNIEIYQTLKKTFKHEIMNWNNKCCNRYNTKKIPPLLTHEMFWILLWNNRWRKDVMHVCRNKRKKNRKYTENKWNMNNNHLDLFSR